MAITVGTDSYISVVDADTYWADRNNLNWETADVADKEKALRDATTYIEGEYAGRWIGDHPGSTSQRLAWPRNGARDFEGRDVTGIPWQVEEACARLAFDGLVGFLTSAESRGGAISDAALGSLEVSYFDGAPAGTTYPYLDEMLVWLLVGGGQSNKLVRV